MLNKTLESLKSAFSKSIVDSESIHVDLWYDYSTLNTFFLFLLSDLGLVLQLNGASPAILQVYFLA